MKTYLTLALYFLTGSCLIFCVLLLLSSSPLKKGEPTISWQISAQDTAPVKRRILKRQTFVFDKDNAERKLDDVASTTTTSAPSTVNLTTSEPDNVTTEFPLTTSTENSTTSGTTTAENITTSAATTTSSDNSTTSAATATTSFENITTSATTTSFENITTSATTTSFENITTSATTTSSENTTTSAATTTSSENTTTLPATTSNENNTTTTTDALTTSNSEQTTTDEPNIAKIANLPWIISAVGGLALATIILIVIILASWFTYHHKKSKSIRQVQRPDSELEDSVLWENGGHQHKEDDETVHVPQPDEYANAVNAYLKQHAEYTKNGPLRRRELGSRMQKHWYSGVCGREDNENKKLLTASPVSQSCPLKLHKHLKGLNKLLVAIKEHPYLHPIEQVEFLVDHQLLVMVQPFVHSGSLKDLIYQTSPLKAWSEKYAKRSRGLPTNKLALYGRQILEAMKFLYSQGFPTLGHVQTGNIFVVNDGCQLGGYENTLLGYKTRLFRLCKDDLEHFDIILFGHVIFEMAAGYELTQTCPGQADYMAVDMRVKPVLEYIFEEGFPHDITEISTHEFFCTNVSLRELCDFDLSKIHLSDSMNTVLVKVRKNKPRVQKEPKTTSEVTLPKWNLKNPLKQGGIGGSKSQAEPQEDNVLTKKKTSRIFSKNQKESEEETKPLLQ